MILRPRHRPVSFPKYCSLIPGIMAGMPSGGAGGGDPFYDDVLALLHFDGSNGSTTFTDEKGGTWTATGNAQHSTTDPKFGSAAATFDGGGDWITGVNSAFARGIDDYTMECWGRFGSLVGNRFLWGFGGVTTNRGVYSFNTGTPTLAYFDGAANQSTSTGHVIDTYYHVALCRAGGRTRLFKNGVPGAEYVDSINLDGNTIRIGNSLDGSGDLLGRIDDFRVTRVARYTGTFAPPSAPFANSRSALIDPHFANVVSLLHFDGANSQSWYLDRCGKKWAQGGGAILNTAIKQFGSSSLNLTFSVDSVTTAASADFAYGTGDYCIEMWIRPAAAIGADQVLLDHRSNVLEGHITIVLGATNKIWYTNGGVIVAQSANGAITPLAWQHIAVTRSGGTGRIFVGGVEVASAADAGNYPASSCGISIVRSGGFDSFTFGGHVDDLRITKGVARYTAGFTPPSAAFPDS